jgi:gamma-glutamyltranspeptidase/glutathione hydrolase
MRDIQRPGRSVVISGDAMIATSQPMASQVGLEVLKSGGNALDAAIAANAVLCVTEPQSTGIGGDCFILIHEAKSGKLHGLNGSGRAPAKATPDAYRKLGHASIPERGILSVTVPGAVDAWQTALERFGTRGLDKLLQPAIRYAEEGYAVTEVVGHFWKRGEALLAQYPDSRRTMLVDGKAPATGTRHRQPELGQALRHIAKQGKKAFYEGPIAQEIVRASRSVGGLLELDDFAEHRTEWVEPISTDYRGIRLFEIPPNGQGITALMTLNMLERGQLGALQHLSGDYIHLVTEAHKLATAERNRFVSDPDFSKIPVDLLLSKDFAEQQRGRIDACRVLPHPVASGIAESRDTIYLTVVDKDRNCVSFINSLYMGFGSGMVGGTSGVMLQNRGYGFVLQDGHFNCIGPRKRPMHTIIPAMAYRGSQPILCFGVMGGQYQAMGHVTVFTNWLDFGMNIQEALDAPRFLPQNGVLTVERPIPQDVRRDLERRGHKVAEADVPFGGGQIVYLDWETGLLHGASDARKDGYAMGY